MKTTEVIDLSQEKVSARYGVCYASGSVFKPVSRGGTSFTVEIGKRRLVSRALCATQYFGSRCAVCPFSVGDLHLASHEQ
jgi:hypothetical protein